MRDIIPDLEDIDAIRSGTPFFDGIRRQKCLKIGEKTSIMIIDTVLLGE